MVRTLDRLVMALAVAIPATASAALYEEVTRTHLPPNLAGACMNAAAGDVDGDGDADLALAMEFEPKILLLNDGGGHFSDASSQLPRTVHDSEDVAFADFDGDGDLDLVFVSEDDRTDELFINDGRGRYTDASERITTDDVTNGLILLDLDGDGRLDVLTANIGLERALISDGQGGFRDDTGMRWPQAGESRTQALETGDVDGDGDLDVIVANEGQNQLYLNDDGRLTDVTSTHLPAIDDETRDIRAVDVDGDTDLDLIVGNVTFLMQASAQDYLLLNDGGGHFTLAAASAFPEDARSNFTLKTLDIDRDGDIDAVAPSTVFADFAAEFAFLVRDTDGQRHVLLGDMFLDDLDGDGDPDARISDGAREVVLVNDGMGLTYPAGEAPWSSMATVENYDINANGEFDLVFAEIGSNLFGGPADGWQSGSMQVFDLGRDGIIDIFAQVSRTMREAGGYQVLLNDGNGNFVVAASGSVLPTSADGNGFDVEVADFDGDGLQDLFLCNRTSAAQSADQSRVGGLQRLLRGIAE
ncbi:MAG TPA: VCBS repeat-containing protein [Pseudomonadales bacterium]